MAQPTRNLFVALKLPFPYSLTFFSPGRNHFQAASKLVFESFWRLFTRFSLETVFRGGSENFLGLLGKFSGPPLKTPSYMDFDSYIHPPITEITQGATLADELYPHFYLKKIFPGSNPNSAEMAEPGFEPGTFWLLDRHLSQLIYQGLVRNCWC